MEKRLQDISRADELHEVKKAVRELKLSLKTAQKRERANIAQLAAAEKLDNQAASLEALLQVVSNERKATQEQVAVLEVSVESLTIKHADELPRLRAKEVELGADLDVTAVSDFSIGKLDLPQIAEDMPDDFFAKVSSGGNGGDCEQRRDGDRYEDGEFDTEE